MITAGGTRIACVLVGLPGRNKTLLAHKVCRYLQWLGVPTRVFNVGNYRRSLYGAAQPHSFFDPANEEGAAQRHHSSQVALDDLVQWLTRHGGTVAIYDATNSTVERRQSIREKCTAKGIEVMFVETICDDESVILENVLQVKLHSPDYEHLPALEKAVVDDFVQRIAHYKDTYVSVNEHGDETDSSFVRLVNLGSSIVIQHITCYLQSRVVFYLMNLHSMPRAIFFTRHGESMANVSGKLGGDTDLSPRGHMYAKTLPRLIKEHMGDRPLTVWTSTLRRTIQTVRYLDYPKLHWKALDELDAGVCDGLTYEEVAELYPQEYAARDEDKFNYRYPGGESYRDVVLRLEPVIMELERQKDILIAGHQAVLRCIYAYFLNYSPDDLPYIKIPLHTVMKLTPTAYGCDIEQYKFDIGAVDTHRPNPKKQASSST
ncbi:bifunctional 6-phosphofructo-2-kinase/fructose-2,6-bisphosphate 2-phosphatase, partial [Ramicandelaber brevisporus]